MQEQIQFTEFFADAFENICDFVVLRHVAWQNQSIRAKSSREFRDIFLHALTLISEREFRAFARPRLRDGPRDGTFVGDAEDDPGFSVEHWHNRE